MRKEHDGGKGRMGRMGRMRRGGEKVGGLKVGAWRGGLGWTWGGG